MNIERAEELARQAHKLVGSITPYQFDEGDDTPHLRPGYTEDDARRILNAEGWLSGAVAGIDQAVANDISKGVFIFTTSLTKGLAVAHGDLLEVSPVGLENLDTNADIHQALCLIRSALSDLDLYPDEPLVQEVAEW